MEGKADKAVSYIEWLRPSRGQPPFRAKLGAAGVPEPEKLLNTVWGVGYRWKSED